MIANSDLKEGDLVPIACRHCASVALSIKITSSVLQMSCPKCGKASEVQVHNGNCGWTVSVKAVSRESAETLRRPAADRRVEPLIHGSQASQRDSSESIIRKALVADVPAIARVHIDSLRTTYRDLLPEEHLAKLSYEKREERKCPRDPIAKRLTLSGGGRALTAGACILEGYPIHGKPEVE